MLAIASLCKEGEKENLQWWVEEVKKSPELILSLTAVSTHWECMF